MPTSTARNHTAPLIATIDARRDAKILELHAEGLSQRKIAAEIGCGQATISKVLSDRKSPEDKTDHPQSPEAIDEDDAPFFDEEDCDTTPATNPATAFDNALKEEC